MADIQNVIRSAIVAGAAAAAASPSTNATPSDTREIAARVEREVAPVVAHATNSEPWYQSRVTLGSLLGIVAGIVGIFGYSFGIEDQAKVVDLIIALAPVIGGALALYGRWAAKKPLGQ